MTFGNNENLRYLISKIDKYDETAILNLMEACKEYLPEILFYVPEEYRTKNMWLYVLRNSGLYIGRKIYKSLDKKFINNKEIYFTALKNSLTDNYSYVTLDDIFTEIKLEEYAFVRRCISNMQVSDQDLIEIVHKTIESGSYSYAAKYLDIHIHSYEKIINILKEMNDPELTYDYIYDHIRLCFDSGCYSIEKFYNSFPEIVVDVCKKVFKLYFGFRCLEALSKLENPDKFIIDNLLELYNNVKDLSELLDSCRDYDKSEKNTVFYTMELANAIHAKIRDIQEKENTRLSLWSRIKEFRRKNKF